MDEMQKTTDQQISPTQLVSVCAASGYLVQRLVVVLRLTCCCIPSVQTAII